jgi:hypothetical protein
MDTLNPILNALVQDLVRQLTPVVVQAIAGELENYKLQTDQKISDALDVNRNWVRGVVGEVLDQDLRGRVADVIDTMDDQHIIDVEAMAARVIDNLDMGDLAEKVFEEVDLTDLAEKVIDEIDWKTRSKSFSTTTRSLFLCLKGPTWDYSTKHKAPCVTCMTCAMQYRTK